MEYIPPVPKKAPPPQPPPEPYVFYVKNRFRNDLANHKITFQQMLDDYMTGPGLRLPKVITGYTVQVQFEENGQVQFSSAAYLLKKNASGVYESSGFVYGDRPGYSEAAKFNINMDIEIIRFDSLIEVTMNGYDI